MSPAMNLVAETERENELPESLSQKGVIYLCKKGIENVPTKYILPPLERPNLSYTSTNSSSHNLNLPIIDFSQLQGSNRSHVLNSLATACEEYGFFQLVNHGIPNQVISNMFDVAKRFFKLPFEERSKYMSTDMGSAVRCGTSFNQNKDSVFCWRDFLKLSCQPYSDVLPLWPSSPTDLRQTTFDYSKELKNLYLMLVDAILENLGLLENSKEEDESKNGSCGLEEFEDGSQLIVMNCYPSCPEPELTLGMTPHSDYGFLTLLLQDQLVKGLQILHGGNWVNVEPIPNSFVVNVGDHLEIFSNGKYQSVLHRVLATSTSRISVASLHSLPFNRMIQPAPKLVNEANPSRYKPTDFASFLDYNSSSEPRQKSFLDSRKLT
ncbi:probable 2-oxoglutarate-dependent dioxygenase SLC1 [Mangifera indica]|uniref:probable 2-oxoglutarate-dependent dioxygenase SLC1 n=1 Tax=Mangifera indica TaxID=29780 RepID=UPI001CF9BDCB|nr:probable 2-oxoglutarate-dependent dioxygenase SLC1 [Mangifera indica]